jgi:transmembrane sensor
MREISEELLEKYFKGLCTEEEAAIVEASLLKDYEESDALTPLPEGYKEEMLEAIVLETAVKRVPKIRYIRALVAAACMLLLVTGWLLLTLREKKDKTIDKPQLAVVWVGKHNADNKKVRVQLPDSSEMVLSPGATVRYRKDFEQYNRREIHVEGSATFTVIKDKNIPFVVYSEGLQTTVMGTIFEVTAEKGSDHIKVRLLEGNLIVRLDSLVKDSTRKYFLSPGQELIYGKWNKSVVIQKIKPVGGGGYAYSRVNRLPGHPDSLSNWYMFNNQPLADVFDQISILYNVDIQYSSAELRNKYFIGKLEKKDSLSKILRDITLLNHLSVTVLEGRYIIRKRNP